MREHGSKKIAPVVVAICLIGYYITGAIILSKLSFPNTVKIIVISASVIITAVIIMVLIERIREIDGGEEDDLGKY
jgi:hypothetical protein